MLIMILSKKILFYRYFDTPPQLFHVILKMTISWFYTCMKWKYGKKSEKCERGYQNTCKRLTLGVSKKLVAVLVMSKKLVAVLVTKNEKEKVVLVRSKSRRQMFCLCVVHVQIRNQVLQVRNWLLVICPFLITMLLSLSDKCPCTENSTKLGFPFSPIFPPFYKVKLD